DRRDQYSRRHHQRRTRDGANTWSSRESGRTATRGSPETTGRTASTITTAAAILRHERAREPTPGAAEKAGVQPPAAAQKTPVAQPSASPPRPAEKHDEDDETAPGHTSPVVRRLAREHGVDLSALAGKGTGIG